MSTTSSLFRHRQTTAAGPLPEAARGAWAQSNVRRCLSWTANNMATEAPFGPNKQACAAPAGAQSPLAMGPVAQAVRRSIDSRPSNGALFAPGSLAGGELYPSRACYQVCQQLNELATALRSHIDERLHVSAAARQALAQHHRRVAEPIEQLLQASQQGASFSPRERKMLNELAQSQAFIPPSLTAATTMDEGEAKQLALYVQGLDRARHCYRGAL